MVKYSFHRLLQHSLLTSDRRSVNHKNSKSFKNTSQNLNKPLSFQPYRKSSEQSIAHRDGVLRSACDLPPQTTLNEKWRYIGVWLCLRYMPILHPHYMRRCHKVAYLCDAVYFGINSSTSWKEGGGARGSAVGWGTALQAGRSRVRFSIVS